MAAKQTEEKKRHCMRDCPVTMNSPGTATPSSIKNHTSKPTQGSRGMKTSSTIPTTAIRAVTLTALLGKG